MVCAVGHLKKLSRGTWIAAEEYLEQVRQSPPLYNRWEEAERQAAMANWLQLRSATSEGWAELARQLAALPAAAEEWLVRLGLNGGAPTPA